MRWRREAYRQSSRIDCLSAIQTAMSLSQPLDLHTPVTPAVAATATNKIISAVDKLGDRYGLSPLGNVLGLNPSAVQQAWNLPSLSEATSILGGNAGAIGAEVPAPSQTARPAVTLAEVAADSAGLQNLATARGRILTNTQQQLKGQP
jgi:hypothetical protein